MTDPLRTPAALPRALSQPVAQRDRLLRLHTPLGPDALVAEALHGWESLDGGGFALELTALSADAGLPLHELLAKPVLLELLGDDSRTRLRPFHGHVTACERLGANGGLARYRLRVEPWLAMLRLRSDSFVFQGLTAVEILEQVFNGHGDLAPAWRWVLSDASVYRRRTACTQYQESDHDFVHRLMAEEGLFYRFEHEGDAGSDPLGRHVMVIGDSDAAFGDRPGTPVRFQRADATEREDAIQTWQPRAGLGVSRVVRGSWDYRTHQWRETQSEPTAPGALALHDDDASGPYTWPDLETGERLARQHLDARRVALHQVEGAGSWRRMAPGLRFALTGWHGLSDADAASHVCLRVEHAARSNLGDELHAAVAQHLGPAQPRVALPAPLQGVGSDVAEGPLREVDSYRNRFWALPSVHTYRPATAGEDGTRLHPRPRAHGVQSAVVVGDAAPVQTDRDHRVLVQFHWQRGARASSALEHPRGDDNACGQAPGPSARAWVRVATPISGANWGTHFIPRVGQEVLVAFLEGDIDRPVIVGGVYNGRGHEDAPHNQVAPGPSGATGNAPAWFSGNGHPAAMSGFKSQALANSASGDGDFQQLVFDDTPGQPRVELSTTRSDTALQLGHLKQQDDNLREADLGFGAHMRTGGQGALRAGNGLLLSTAHGAQQLTADAARAQVGRSISLIDGLSQAALNQQASLPEEAATLPALGAVDALAEAIRTSRDEGDSGTGAGSGPASVFEHPMLLAESAAGLVAATPASQVWTSGTQTLLSAQLDLDWISQGSCVLGASRGVSVFTHGAASRPDKPNEETGISMHAASGAVGAQAQRGPASAKSRETLTVASHSGAVSLAAKRHLLLAAAGAFLKLDGENIELGAPGSIDFKAARRELTDPRGGAGPAVSLPQAGPINDEQFLLRDKTTGEPLAFASYRAVLEDGSEINGVTSADGRTMRISTGASTQGIRLYLD